MNKQLGGYITTSKMSKIIVKLSTQYNQTPQAKRDINKTITNTGHGSLFLGSSARLENGDDNIRMLIGAHYSHGGRLKVGVFGGGCERDEITIDTIIRETIEEIFNILPHKQIIANIRDFLNTNTDYYFIVPTSSGKAYSYIFDVSVLGDFIKIMTDYDSSLGVPNKNNTLTNLSTYLISDAKFTDESSFNGINNPPIYDLSYLFSLVGLRYGPYPTINLVEFMRERKVGRYYRNINRRVGLNEIRYLSFASLNKILASVPSGYYKIFDFTSNNRESLEFQSLFLKLITTSLKDILLDISK